MKTFSEGTNNSDSIHNLNCYNYLKRLTFPSSIEIENDKTGFVSLLNSIQRRTTDYDSKFAYGDLYKKFFELAEENIKQLYENTSNNREQRKQLDNFVKSIYENDNNILNTTYNHIQSLTSEQRPISPPLQNTIQNNLMDKGNRVNQSISPSQAGGSVERFKAFMTRNFKPQHTTSLATVIDYSYLKDINSTQVKQLRFGTQGQRHDGKERVSPLFERFIAAQANPDLNDSSNTNPSITHIYFNQLGRDRTDFEGRGEAKLTAKLEEMEDKHKNIAVITLPADKGLMASKSYEKLEPKYSYKDVFDEFLLIALENDQEAAKIKDFHISQYVRHKLFEQGTSGEAKLRELLRNSFNAVLGMNPPSINETKLSDSQRQAVWFHFNKYELPNFIIEELKPKTINFSCKDAIDRGGVASAYYNLIKSFGSNSPMSREEFDRALHAAPAMVKGRGMNHHQHVIWNAINEYVNHNPDKLIDANKAWLIEWRDMNCPHARVNDILKTRVMECITKLSSGETGLMKSGVEILNNINSQLGSGVSGNRLLLEAVVSTTKMALNEGQTPQNEINRYQALSEELKIKHPRLQYIAGMMKQFAGTMLNSEKLKQSGQATMNAVTNNSSREKLIDLTQKYHDAIHAISHPSETNHNQDNISDHGAVTHNNQI